MRSVKILALGILLAASAPGLLAQGAPAGGTTTVPSAVPPAPTHARKAKRLSTKPAVRKASASSDEASGTQSSGEGRLARRDPFESLVSRQTTAGLAKNLPPGKAGLQVSTLRLDGIVKSSNGMIAVVSNPQARTYFLREGDQLYDGQVEKIAMDGVSFHELGKDAFGKPVERQVNKRIYASAGEQQ
jgi:hypothetical protein